MLKSLTKLLSLAVILLTSSLLSFDSFEPGGTALGKWEMALSQPLQTPLSSSKPVAPIMLEKEGVSWHMFPRANYRIAARVLQRKQYDDWQAAFAPVDLALGWGKIGMPEIDKWIDWRQSDRWYYYRLRNRLILDSPLSQDYVREHSANVHVVPATTRLASALQRLERNSLVLMEGKLVDIEAHKEGTVHHFSTSLSRTDRGDASCEIMYVERLVTKGIEYR